jgi:signal peptidase complex subunit 2
MADISLKITISTATKKNVPKYELTITVTSAGKPGAKPETIKVTRPFTEWFDSAGHFIAAPFQSIFATAVPLIGRADPKRVTATAPLTATQASIQDLTPDMLDAVLAADKASAVSGSEASSSRKKAGKRRVA